MDRLITDTFTRRVVQVLIAIIFLGLTFVPLAILAVLAMKALGGLVGGRLEFALILISLVALPLSDSVAQISTVFVSTFPVVVAAVCYVRDITASPPKVGDQLNPLGKAAVIVLLVGAVASVITLLVMGSYLGLVTQINRNEAQALLVKGVVGGILSFQFLYVVRLLGLETNKNAP